MTDRDKPSEADPRVPESGGASSLESIAPGELMLARCRAFGAGDFALIYDSYHPEANFLGHFPDRDAYIRYGRESLARQYRILECRVLRERAADKEAWVLLYQMVEHRGERSEQLERALVLRTAGGWRYLGGQKMERADFPGPLEAIDWADFDRAQDKIFY